MPKRTFTLSGQEQSQSQPQEEENIEREDSIDSLGIEGETPKETDNQTAIAQMSDQNTGPEQPKRPVGPTDQPAPTPRPPGNTDLLPSKRTSDHRDNHGEGSSTYQANNPPEQSHREWLGIDQYPKPQASESGVPQQHGGDEDILTGNKPFAVQLGRTKRLG